MIRDGFGIQNFIGAILGWSTDRKILEALVESDPLLGDAEIVPLKINETPLTEEGEAIKAECERIWKEKNISRLRFDKSAAYYAMSMDERWKLVHTMLTIEGEPLDFDDRTRPVNLDL